MIMILSDKDLKKNLMGTKKDTISYICQEMYVTPKCKSEFGNEKSLRITSSLRANAERLLKPKKETEVKKLGITAGKINPSLAASGTQGLCMYDEGRRATTSTWTHSPQSTPRCQ